LLSDVFTTAINLTLILEDKMGKTANGTNYLDAFNGEILIFQNNM
jgi:hypothetical protein